MSVLTDLIYGGTNAVAGLTECAVHDAITRYGADREIGFPNTDFFFPILYAVTGKKVRTLGDLIPCIGVIKKLITNHEDLGQALNAGLASAVGAEILEGLKWVKHADPYAADSGIGFISDAVIRRLGFPLVTGELPGVALVMGRADDGTDMVKLVSDYQSRGVLTFLVGDVIEQAAAGVRMGQEHRVLPLGHDATSAIHMISAAVRAALIFGEIQPGNLAGLLEYTRHTIPAVVNTFGTIDTMVISAGAGAIALGFPVVVDIDLADNQVPGALVSVCDHSKTVETSLRLRKDVLPVTATSDYILRQLTA